MLALCVMPLCVSPFSVMPFSAWYLCGSGFFSISSSYRGLSFTNFDSVYFRFDLTLFTFRLLNFVIDIPSYSNAEFRPSVSRWLQTGKFAEICDLWFALGAKESWSKITNGKKNYRVLPRWNLEAIGAVGANFRPFSFGGSVEPLRWSAQPW